MRHRLFTRRGLRASYRNHPADFVLALIQEAHDQDELAFESYSHAPRFRRARMNEEEE